MSMSTSKPAPAPCTAPPEIDQSDLNAVRRFLTSYRDEQRSAGPITLPGDPKGPTLRIGITRARLRSAAKNGD
jgi:hypothetical protein